MRTLIRGGTVVSAAGSSTADVLVDGERIAALAAPGTHNWAAGADRVIEAADRYVLPGAVDVHTHMELPVSGTVSADDFDTGTRAALHGGTTTIVDYAGQDRGGGLLEGVARWGERAAGRAWCDYGFHLMVTDVRDDTLAELPALVAAGVTSIKLFTAYPGSNYSDDGQILRAMQRAADLDVTVMMHAENGIAIDVLRAQAIARGDTDPIHHLLTRPASLEAEAVERVVRLAEIAGCRLVIVHISSAEALRAAVAGRDRGLPVFAETCPQYLALAIEDVPDGDDAARFVCSPPLRWRDEGHQAALWDGIASRRVDTVATDHCPFTWAQKQAGRGDFTRIPNGVGSVEHRLDLVHQGVVDGRISRERWVEVCSTDPARLAGLHPRKGVLAPGADADVVVYDPTARHTLSAATHHMNVDYSVYEGMEVTGRTETVLLRGQVVVERGEVVGGAGGRFLTRGSSSLT
ncbi:MAG TPA: dihydropyrimidinase [Egicoccus sp.]|nr:dihydropyrimidinase [Egicoccus sp.]HSK22139.1 dihydropyrimidinase [Egicoccus sp.]